MAGGLVGWFEDVGGEIAEAVVDFSQWYTRAMGLNALWDWMMPDMPEIEYPGVKLNKTGTNLPLPLIYGTRRVGGVIVFKAVDPADTGILHQVIVLGEGEVFSIGDIYLGDDLSTDPKFDGLVTITKYNGTTTQAADPDLVATFPDYTVGTRLKGVAYLHVKLTYNRDVFRGIPIVTADVMGKRVFNPHLGAVTYSTNPAWVLRDYLLSPTYGKGLPASAIDETSFSDAALACDVLMPSYAGSGVHIKTFETNAVVNTNRSVSANITALLAQCRGNLVYTGGKYRLEIEGTKASTFSLNADNILSRSGVKSGGKRSRLNGVKVEFTNPLTDWEKDYAITASATMLAEDGGLILETTVNRPFETSPYRAQYIAETLVKKSRESILATFLVNHSALAVEVADIVDVTHASLGWVGKLFRVVAVEIRSDLTVGLALAEYEPTTYDRTIPASAFVSPPDTNLADPTVVQPPTGLTISSGTHHLLALGDGTIISRAKVTWTASADPYLDHYEVQGSKAPSGSWSDVPPVTTTTVAAYMGSVQDGQAYFFRVRAVNTAGVASAWVTSAQHTVIGKQDAPGIPINLAYATTTEGRRRLTWQMGIIEPDLAGFQIRYFAGTGGTWNTATDLHAGLVSVDPNVAINTDFAYEFDHLPAGTYEFFVRPWDTSGLTSIAPGSVTGVTLPDPPGGGATWGVDITGQPADAALLNNQQQWADVGGVGRPQDNATVGATWDGDITGQPVVEQWRNQILDPSSWVVGTTGTQGVMGNGDVVSYFGRNGLTSENNIVSGLDQVGREVPLWQCIPSGDSNGDGGWNTGQFVIDPDKAYRYSVWVKRTLSNDGSTYLGVYGYDSGGTNIGVSRVSDSLTVTNPYFWSGDLPILDRWYLIVGYVHGQGGTNTTSIGGVYDGVTGGKVLTAQDYRWLPGTATSLHRAYLYYAATGVPRQYFVHPRVDLIDGNEPSVAALLGLADVTQTVMDTGILTTGAVWMNSGTFGAKGIQAEYNGGNPRLHVGDGANKFLKYDGTNLTWKAANTELDPAGNLTATNATFDNATMTNAV
ncbi:MAG: phage tail protein, partial [Leptospirillia bacterium]